MDDDGSGILTSFNSPDCYREFWSKVAKLCSFFTDLVPEATTDSDRNVLPEDLRNLADGLKTSALNVACQANGITINLQKDLLQVENIRLSIRTRVSRCYTGATWI